MFKILNNATPEEIAIITAVVDTINSKNDKKVKSINDWDYSSKNSNYLRTLWKSKNLSNWEKSNRVY